MAHTSREHRRRLVAVEVVSLPAAAFSCSRIAPTVPPLCPPTYRKWALEEALRSLPHLPSFELGLHSEYRGHMGPRSSSRWMIGLGDLRRRSWLTPQQLVLQGQRDRAWTPRSTPGH
jgi:hypothetical protein